MHVKAKKMAFGGMLLALTIVCMLLGSIIETNTLFLLAAASFFVGIVLREFGEKTGIAFYIAGVLLGLIVAPNKFYVLSYAAMGLYILVIELAWPCLGKLAEIKNRKRLFWIIKYIVFDIIYIPAVCFFQELLFAHRLSSGVLIAVLLTGQAGLFIYDRAYEFFQRDVWSKFRGRFFRSGN